MTELQDENMETPKNLSEGLQIPLPTIYNWIRQDKIPHIKKDGYIYLERDKIFGNATLSTYINKRIHSNHEPYFPDELAKYHDWHQTLDAFSWLFKVCYSPSNDIREKKLIFPRKSGHNEELVAV